MYLSVLIVRLSGEGMESLPVSYRFFYMFIDIDAGLQTFLFVLLCVFEHERDEKR